MSRSVLWTGIVLAGLMAAVVGCSGDAPVLDVTTTSSSPTLESPLPPPATVPVPVPSGGRVTETAEPPGSAAPTQEATIGAAATVASRVQARITKVEAITATPQGPGEVGGPAVAVTIEVANGGASAFDLSLVSVNLTDSEGLPASGMTGSPATWLEGSLPAGKVRSGVYVFTVPASQRSPVRVELSLHPSLPAVVFSGAVS